MESEFVKIVVFVPLTHADNIREVLGNSGTGKIGSYAFCSFSVRGVGRFLPTQGAHPTIGTVGKLEAVDEERIEVLCERNNLQQVIRAVKAVHPYEEPAIDVYPVEVTS